MKTTKFVYSDTDVYIHAFDDNSVADVLRPAVYQLNFQKMVGFYLTLISDRFDTPDVVYGCIDRRVDRVLTTYGERTQSMGVLLSGQKGAGKTMTATRICNEMIDLGKPVILINQAYAGTDFLDFLGNIGETVLLFDEFGKTYSDNNSKKGGSGLSCDSDDFGQAEGSKCDKQSELLSLFDGTLSCKRLIILTENDIDDVDSCMVNRPGRILYHFRHGKLSDDMIVEYCRSVDVPQSVIDQIIAIRMKSETFSFDIMVAIVAEWSRYGRDDESIDSIVEDLNVPGDMKKTQVMKLDTIHDADNNPVYVTDETRSTHYDVPELGSQCIIVRYFLSKAESLGPSGHHNYDAELNVSVRISDITDMTSQHITFTNRRSGCVLRFKLIK